MAEKTIALLVAGGTSQRMGGGLAKPYLAIGQDSLMRQSVKAFLTHPGIDGVRVVIRREHHLLYKQAVLGLTLFPCVIGGDTRQESVRRGLESIAHRGCERVLVHDVARPFVSHALISRMLEALDTHKAAVPALPVVDTVKRGVNGAVAGPAISREGLFTVQTPQAFHFASLLAAHQRFAGEQLTDDAALMEKLGTPVALVEGQADNIKITTQKDMDMMQAQLSHALETRTGFGFDVHALKPHHAETPVAQRTITLCGVEIESNMYLEGHSDADVGLHAAVDAILGALADGDIGTHFPPDDPRWQGADSTRFLLHAYELLKSRGGELAHLDITIICERPKISPHREAMIRHIVQALKIAPSRISVKATTTEKLGFTGRGEGIAAQAVATLRLPKEAA